MRRLQEICAADGEPKTPTWAIQADQVIQDPQHKVIYYHHAVIRVAGLPVAYMPIFWHVDPTAKRGSGLLAPQIAVDRRGFSYQLVRAVAKMEDEALQTALERLAEADILLVQGLPPESDYRFINQYISR